MNVFYTPDISGDVCVLNESESHHIIKVLRKKEGEDVYLIDGNGGFFQGNITEAHPKHCKVTISAQLEANETRNYRLHLAIAPTKNINRFDWLLEKITEIGIDEITPVISFHSERKKIKSNRAENIVISAMKQSLKSYKPVIHNITGFNDFVNQDFKEKKIIAHCRDDTNKKALQDQINHGENILILIGPEGGFSEEELKHARGKGFLPTHFGNSRLRTETAGIAACYTVYLSNM